MASLGIDDAKPATPSIVRTRDRSSSCSSCSSLGSSADGWSPIRCARDIDPDRRLNASRRVRAVRYSPYISASVSVLLHQSVCCLIPVKSTARHSSAVSLSPSQSDQEDSSRVSTSTLPSTHFFLTSLKTVFITKSPFVPSAHATAFTSSFLQERKVIHHSNFIIRSSQDTTKLACRPYFRSTGVRRETRSHHSTIIDADVIAHHPPSSC